jgi:hypothetical protein
MSPQTTLQVLHRHRQAMERSRWTTQRDAHNTGQAHSTLFASLTSEMQCTRTPVTNKHHLMCKHGHRWHATVEYLALRHPSLKHHNTITRLTLNANSTYSAPRALQGRKWMAWSGQLTMSTHAQARMHDRHNMDPHEARASRPLTHKDVNAVLVVPRMQMLLRRRRKGRAVAILRAARRQRLVTQPRTTDANIASGHFYLGTKDAIRSPERSCEAGNRGGSRLQSTLSGDASIYRHRLQAHHIQQAALDWLPERRHTAAGRREKLAVTSSAAVFPLPRKPTDQAFPAFHLRIQGSRDFEQRNPLYDPTMEARCLAFAVSTWPS